MSNVAQFRKPGNSRKLAILRALHDLAEEVAALPSDAEFEGMVVALAYTSEGQSEVKRVTVSASFSSAVGLCEVAKHGVLAEMGAA